MEYAQKMCWASNTLILFTLGQIVSPLPLCPQCLLDYHPSLVLSVLKHIVLRHIERQHLSKPMKWENARTTAPRYLYNQQDAFATCILDVTAEVPHCQPLQHMYGRKLDEVEKTTPAGTKPLPLSGNRDQSIQLVIHPVHRSRIC